MKLLKNLILSVCLSVFVTTPVFADVAYQYVYDGREWVAQGASLPITSVGPAVVIKNSPGRLLSLNVESGASAGYVLVLDTPALPSANGALSPASILYHRQILASSTLDRTFETPISLSNGIVVVCSSSLTQYVSISCPLITVQFN